MNVYEKIYKDNGLSSTQQEIINKVGTDKVILEIGASAGYMTKCFLKNNCTVDVVEINKSALEKIPKSVRKKINLSIEDKNINKLLSRDYDFIIMADVLEHLINPEEVLKFLKNIASDKTYLIVSMPNIASWIMRKQLFLEGNFEYQDSGILDKTHLHFYTIKTLPKMLSECGWDTKDIKGTITRLPFESSIGRVPVLGWFFKNLFYKKIVEKYPNLSYYHFFVTALKK